MHSSAETDPASVVGKDVMENTIAQTTVMRRTVLQVISLLWPMEYFQLLFIPMRCLECIYMRMKNLDSTVYYPVNYAVNSVR